MNQVSILSAVLTLLAGIGVFLVACSTMSANLEAAGSSRLKELFAKASGSRLLGVGIGALGTAAIQSSGATTVMVIGFVNAGILSLRQAATVIYGANIGTTITGQIVALGAILTAIIQSSSVMTSIAITMVVSGLITLDQGIFLTMGSNIGSCVVAILAGFSSSLNAKRTAMIHLTFNVLGVILFLFLAAAIRLATAGALSMGALFAAAFPGAPQTQLAMFHTVFIVLTVVLVLPLTDLLVRYVERLFPEPKEPRPTGNEPRLYYLDEHMLRTPAIAVGQLKREIENMADIAMRNFSLALDMICSLDYEAIEEFRGNEEELNFLNRELVRYAVKLSDKKLARRDRLYLISTFRSISDLERVGDYAENIVEYADSLRNANDHFSAEAVAEIGTLKGLVESLFQHVVKAYDQSDLKELSLADEVEDQVDAFTACMADNHVRRLTDGVCTPNAGAQYLELSSDAERVADHLINVAATIRKFK